MSDRLAPGSTSSSRNPIDYGLANSRVVITGGAGGIGRALARRLAVTDALVVLLDLQSEALDAAVEEVSQGSTGKVAGVVCDVSDGNAVATATASIARDLGGVDVLFNLAGIGFTGPRTLEDTSLDQFLEVLRSNLLGTFACCQAMVPLIAKAAGNRCIINMSSFAGRAPTLVSNIAYAAAKAGVVGLTRRLAREVAPMGIRVNAVAPGLVVSGPDLVRMWESLTPLGQRELLSAIPLGRLPTMDEVLDPLLFLASHAAGYITGTVLDVNGGRYMG